MIKLKVTTPKSISEELKGLKALSGGGDTLMQAVGSAGEIVLKAHFAKRNREPNKRKWRKTNFWHRIEEATALGSVTNTSAQINISDRAFAAKVNGAVITPQTAKALAIPVSEAAYGKRPKTFGEKLGKELRLIPRNGKPSLLATVNDGKVTPHYVLLKKTVTPKDPRALPSTDEFWDQIMPQVREAVNLSLEK